MNPAAIDTRWLARKLRLDPDAAAIRAIVPVAAGQGLIGSIYRIETAAGSCILKSSPGRESVWYGYLKKLQPFRREAEAYRFLAPHQAVLDRDIPQCFWAEYAPDGTGFLLLENLLERQATVHPLLAPVGEARCRSVFQSAARIHALHAAVRTPANRRPNPHRWLFSGHSRVLAEVLQTGLRRALDLVREHRSSDLPAHRLLQDVVRFDVGRVLRHCHLRSTLVSFCHGDLWLNNVLFVEYPEAIQACIIDWQFASWGNPLVDLSFFLQASLDAPERRRVTEDCLAQYHTHLVQAAPTPLDYSLEACIADYARANAYGVLMSLASLEAFITASPPEEAAFWIEKALNQADDFLTATTTMPRRSGRSAHAFHS